MNDDSEWYGRTRLLNELDTRIIPQPDLNNVLFGRLNDSVTDVAVAAAVRLGLQETTVDTNQPMHTCAGSVLDSFGALKGKPRQKCGIAHAFERLLKQKPPTVNWRKLFGKTYRSAERQAIRWSGSLNDATTWVNLMDVFCDWLLDAIYRNDVSIGKYTLGNIGGVLVSGNRLEEAYPNLFKLVNDIHDQRRNSVLSHAKKRIGNKYVGNTSFIRFKYFETARKLAKSALKELQGKFPLKKTTRRIKMTSAIT